MPIPILPRTMKAVRLKGPFQVACEEVPVPELEHDDEVLVKVKLSGLCGSDLHYYRGHNKSPREFTIGHEVLGTISKIGPSVKKFKVGDVVVAPFSLHCGDCFYCDRGLFARCSRQVAFGGPQADGAQAEYVKLKWADECLKIVPDNIPHDMMLVMSDILPTGFSAAKNARVMLDMDLPAPAKDGVCVVIGCGPVGLCAITSATTMFEKVFATDIASHRLEAATKHGAIALPLEDLVDAVSQATEGRGADAVLEIVGHESALQTALGLVRPFGIVSSCGLHTRPYTLDGFSTYGKNVRFQFGRCSVPKYYDEALAVLHDHREIFATFVENKVPLEQAEEYYKLFEQNKVAKTLFVCD